MFSILISLSSVLEIVLFKVILNPISSFSYILYSYFEFEESKSIAIALKLEVELDEKEKEKR